ncbi:glycoside hydrolase family 16 protein [Winogradskya humida]|nr:glycoside hydrolase family 16 protein [Actinoplanes humidus]
MEQKSTLARSMNSVLRPSRWKLASAVTATALALTSMVNVSAAEAAKSTDAATSTGAAAAAVLPSGQAMPVGNINAWKQIFSDDFNQNVPLGSFPAAVSNKWGAYADGWTDTSKNGTYAPSKVISVKNGVMDMNIRTEDGKSLVSAPVPKINGANAGEGQLYGRYAVRFRSDKLAGYKIAWLLWPDSDQWGEGEIDFPEADLDGKIWGFMHHKNKPMDQDWYETKSATNAWHTAVLEWHPNYVRYLLDGVQIGKSTDVSKIPSTPMHWVLQTETNLDGVKPAAAVAGHLQIDWVAVYKLQR